MKFVKTENLLEHSLREVNTGSLTCPLKLVKCSLEKILILGSLNGFISVYFVDSLINGEELPHYWYNDHQGHITNIQAITGKEDSLIVSVCNKGLLVARSLSE